METGRQSEGVLLPTGPRTELTVEAVLVVLVLASAARYVVGHGLGDQAWLVLPGAAALLVGYAARRVVPAVRRVGWLAAVVLIWLGLVWLAPSFGWCALALAFAALRVLPYRSALGVIAVLVTAVSATWVRMGERFDPTVVLGPVGLALLAVGAYRALDRQAAVQAALLDDLRRAQDELAAAQRREGALAERHRLSREIHDSIAQDLSSINLLLQAAEQSWSDRPDAVREHLRQAAATARDGLVEARRVVHELSPATAPRPDEAARAAAPQHDGRGGGLAQGRSTDGRPLGGSVRGGAPSAAAAGTGDGDGHGEPAASVPDVLCELGQQTAARHGLQVRVEVTGEPTPLPADLATALVRTARGALANVVEHARARTAVVTLSFLGDEVTLDVCDDGQGLPATARATGATAGHAGTPRPADPAAAGRTLRGHGLRGMRDRVEELGGHLVVESAAGSGTAVAVTLPLRPPVARPA